MTREEAKRIIAVICAVYNWKPDNPVMTVDSWAWILEEFSYQDINLALKSYMVNADNNFPPTVSQLIAIAKKPYEKSYIEEGEAWDMVHRALSNSAYNSVAEFEKLPPLIQKAVGSSEQLKRWAIDPEFNGAVESSNFKRQYRKLVDKDKEYQNMPAEFKAIMQRKEQALIEESM